MTAFLRRYYAGGATTTTLASSMTSSDTSFTVNSATGWPGGSGSFICVIDRGTSSEEKILCASNSGTTVTVTTRGYDGTSATSHNANATVSLCGGAIDFDEANQVSHLLGNGAQGSLFIGQGSGTIAAALAVGSSGQYLGVNESGELAYSVPTQITSNTEYSAVASYVSLPQSTITNVTSVSLAAGTWLVLATLMFSSSAAAVVEMALTPTSGAFTSAYAFGYFYQSGAPGIATGNLSAIVTVASTTTVYLVADGSTIGAAYGTTAAGNPATMINAVRIS